MTAGQPEPNLESWAFALQLYAKPGVADACLRLQAEAGVDVMMLLTAVFAAVRRGIVLEPPAIQDMNEVCRPWREQIVQPLRGLRVALKSGPLPAPTGGSEQLRTQIKAAELAAERLQNDLLTEWLEQKAPAPRPVTHEDVRAVVCSVVLLALEKRESEMNSDILSLVDGIVAAAG
ncbi:TIGR02444 family protein [Bradyrhizobium sp. NP1]|uniref:TIGR02444 family protein n=1 Tax=Bradyrhizobium sp. NP1 TaxID=3049772 RepID=UPI0025A59C9B|nr:TIGR02444 family protein [Bradyrhizobium sp. NP1]WJR80975.1 TIGR02444 family protein [Bradyrhizobium sp. NP1]